MRKNTRTREQRAKVVGWKDFIRNSRQNSVMRSENYQRKRTIAVCLCYAIFPKVAIWAVLYIWYAEYSAWTFGVNETICFIRSNKTTFLLTSTNKINTIQIFGCHNHSLCKFLSLTLNIVKYYVHWYWMFTYRELLLLHSPSTVQTFFIFNKKLLNIRLSAIGKKVPRRSHFGILTQTPHRN